MTSEPCPPAPVNDTEAGQTHVTMHDGVVWEWDPTAEPLEWRRAGYLDPGEPPVGDGHYSDTQVPAGPATGTEVAT
jgi:hypothetical protein